MVSQDIGALINSYDYKEIIENLTMDFIEFFLNSLGVNNIEIYNDHIVCPTICHNSLLEEASMKLYYYAENKSFHCYTECSCNMNIFQLYQKYMELNYKSVTFDEAVEYVRDLLRIKKSTTNIPENFLSESRVKDKEVNNHKEILTLSKIETIKLPKINLNVLDYFIPFYHPLWLKEGISKEVMEQFRIRFSIPQNKIVIPHFDLYGNLVGIRARSLNKEDIQKGKYRPITINNVTYSHHLSFNLYGIYENKDAIKKTKRAFIFEGEKGVLLFNTYYGKYSTAVATCGSQLNKFQINILIKKLGVSEIILCYDKEYSDINDPKSKIYKEKLINKCQKYRGLATFYILFDEKNLLKEKDSPVDRGKEVFEKLLAKKILVK